MQQNATRSIVRLWTRLAGLLACLLLAAGFFWMKPVTMYAADRYNLGDYSYELVTLTYNGETSTGFRIVSYTGSETTVSIPSQATITIDGSSKTYAVIAIGEGAFQNNYTLTTVIMSSRIVEIGDDAFNKCTNLKTVSLPYYLRKIGRYAFSHTALSEVALPDRLENVGDYAFYEVLSLQKVTFSENTTTIGSYAFEFCKSLETISFPDKLTRIGGGAFYGCEKLTSVTFGSDIKSIGSNAFCNTGVTNVTIPSSVTTIGDYSFGYLYNKNSTYSRLACTITGWPGSRAQSYASDNEMKFNAVAQYTVDSSDNSIRITAYSGQEKKINIPSAIDGLPVRHFDRNVFKDNATVSEITLPDSFTEIDTYAFFGASGLTKMNLPETITKINAYAFTYCTRLSDINIPDATTMIGYAAFYGCSSLETIRFGSSISSIGTLAFGNTGLYKAEFPASIEMIMERAFGYEYTTDGYMPTGIILCGWPGSEVQRYANENECTFSSYLTYGYTSDEENIIINKYTGWESTVTIPGQLEGKDVTRIKAYAFRETPVEVLTLPDTMTVIDSYALYGAASLKSIKLPDQLQSIESYAFSGCSKLKSVICPDTLQAISNGAFYNCSSLMYVSFGSGLGSIGERAFTNTILKEVEIPKNINSIGSHALGYNYSSSSTFTAVEGFEITGYAGTAAETYAMSDENFIFNPLYEELVNLSETSDDFINAGESIKVYTNATGGKKPYFYTIKYRPSSEEEGDGANTILVCEMTFDEEVEVTFDKAGEYILTVIAGDRIGHSQAHDFLVMVKQVVTEGWKKDARGWWYQNADGTYPKNQWKQIGGKWYHFDKNGYMQTGWYQEGENYYYLKSDGSMAKDEWVDNDKYYVDASGKWVKGKVKDGEAAGTWKKDSKGWWYKLADGTYPKSQWMEIDGKWYYFDDNGYWVKGKVKDDAETGTWKKDSKGWWYQNPDGTYPKNQWKKIDGKWYHFDKNGYMQTGWYKEGSYYYYLKKDGSMAADEYVEDGRYYIDANGHWVEDTE